MNILKVDKRRNIGALIISILIAEGVGILGGFLGMRGENIYETLKKPAFSPPGWVFPIVWTILFLLTAIAAYRVWLKGKSGKNVQKALTLYAIQLILNFLWSIIFFRFKLYGLAFIELLLLLVFILLTTFEFFKIDKTSGFLMIPYILWTSFAAILSYVIWMLNEAI